VRGYFKLINVIIHKREVGPALGGISNPNNRRVKQRG